MQTTLAVTFGRVFRGRRVELDLSQAVLSNSIGIARSHYSAIEAGKANTSVALLDRIAEALGLRLDVTGVPTLVVSAPIVRDALHARCSAYVQRRLESAGWTVLREVEISDGRLRGWIDLVAFHPGTGML